MDNLEVTMTVETENIEQPETEFTQNEETVVEPIDNTEDTSAVYYICFRFHCIPDDIACSSFRFSY